MYTAPVYYRADIQGQTNIHTFGQFRVTMHIFAWWEDAGEPEENPRIKYVIIIVNELALHVLTQ